MMLLQWRVLPYFVPIVQKMIIDSLGHVPLLWLKSSAVPKKARLRSG
jgi:hypothetical protein